MAERITWVDRTNNTSVTGETYEAAATQFNTLKDGINTPALSNGIFIPSAVTFDRTGYFTDYTVTSNLSLTFSGTHYQGVVLSLKILFDGVSSFTIPDGAVILNNSFTNGGVPTSGTYYLFMTYLNSTILVNLTEATASGSIPQLTAPSISSFTADSTSQFTVTFTDPNTSPNEAYVQIQYDTVNTFDASPQTTTAAQDATTKAISGLDLINDQYYVRVRAVGDAITASTSAWSGTGTAPKFPTLVSLTMSADNTYADLVASEGLWGSDVSPVPISLSDLNVVFAQAGGTATDWVASSAKQNDNTVEGSATALVGGETTVRIFGAISGTADGNETVTVTPTDGSSIYDADGNAMDAGQTSVANLAAGSLLFVDTFDTGTIDTSKWTDNTSDPDVVFSQSGGELLCTVSDAVTGFNYLGTDGKFERATSGVTSVFRFDFDLNTATGKAKYNQISNGAVDNIIAINNGAGDNFYIVIVNEGSTDTNEDTGVSSTNSVKAILNGDNTVSFKYWNGAAWVQLGASASYACTDDTYYLRFGTVTGTGVTKYDNVYINDQDYITLIPT